jgi:hypothetical protein
MSQKSHRTLTDILHQPAITIMEKFSQAAQG